jgi:lipopolysaccharide export system permease protein
MQFLWKYLDDLVGKGLETGLILELMSYAALSLVPMALPLSILLASIMSFGNLGERFELLAIKTSGVSLLKIMKPLIFLNIIITIGAFFLANEIIPVTNAKFAALLWSVKEQRPEMIVKEGIFSNEIDGYSIKVNRRDQKTDALHGIMIYDHTSGKGNVSVTIADSGYLNMSDDKKYMILNLFHGENYTDEKPGEKDSKQKYPFRREKFRKQEIVINVHNYDLKRFDESYWKDGYKMLKNSQLDVAVDSLERIYTDREKLVAIGVNYNKILNDVVSNNFSPDSLKKAIPDDPAKIFDFDSLYASLSREQRTTILQHAQRNAQSNQRNVLQYESDLYNRLKYINQHLLEWHRKYTLSVACLVFFFIGAPLGAIIRKGGFGMPVVVSILLFISYYLVSMIGEKVAREGVWMVGSAVWFSTILFFTVGIFLTRQAITDSVLMNSDTYSKVFKKIKILSFLESEKDEVITDENTFPNE